MKAYKVFDENWRCRDYQYEIGKTYQMQGSPVLCHKGFYACIKAIDCFNYYSFDPRNKVAEVELIGEIVGIDGDKQTTNKITIVREIKWAELLDMVNTGYRNSGDRNSGDFHTGVFNSEPAKKAYAFNKLLAMSEIKKIRSSPGANVCERFRLLKYRVRTQSGKYGDYRYLSYKASWRHFWEFLSIKERFDVVSMPHFQPNVFAEITGISLNKISVYYKVSKRGKEND